VLPSLNAKSANSSPFEAPVLTIPPSTLAFLPAASAPESLEISGRDSYLVFLAMDYYTDNINKFEVNKVRKLTWRA